MPTTIRTFPRQNRSGTQQTPYGQLPANIDYIHLIGDALDSTFSNTANSITFIVLASPTGQDSDSHEIQREYWNGGTFFNRFTQTTEPNRLDVTFNLQTVDVNSFLSLRAIFNQTISIGASLIGLP